MQELINAINKFIEKRRLMDLVEDFPAITPEQQKELISFLKVTNMLPPESIENNFILKKALHFVSNIHKDNRINQSQRNIAEQQILCCVQDQYNNLPSLAKEWITIEKNFDDSEEIDPQRALNVLIGAFQKWESDRLTEISRSGRDFKEKFQDLCSKNQDIWLDLCYLTTPKYVGDPVYQEPTRSIFVARTLKHKEMMPSNNPNPVLFNTELKNVVTEQPYIAKSIPEHSFSSISTAEPKDLIDATIEGIAELLYGIFNPSVESPKDDSSKSRKSLR